MVVDPKETPTGRLRRQVNLGLGLGATVLVLIGSVAAWSSLRSQEAVRERRALFDRRDLVENLLSALLGAESGQRGYLLTGDTAYLESYEAVRHSFDGRLALLRTHLAGFPDRAARLDTLEVAVRAKLAHLTRTIELRRAGRMSEAAGATRDGAAMRTMARAREMVASLSGEDAGLLDLWNRRLLAAGRLSFLASSAVALLAVILLFAGVRAINPSLAGRERAEEALGESEQRLVRLIEALPVAVFVLDANGKPFFANRASKAILGRGIDPGMTAGGPPETYGAYIAGTDQVYPAERQPIIRALGGENVHVEDFEIHRPDRVVPLEVWAAPVYDSHGKVAFAVAVFSDIHERREAREAILRLNQEIERRVAELTEVNRELDAFSYSVSHDLRAPVRHVDGFARLLEESSGARLDEDGRHYLARIRDGAGQMSGLIDALLQLSRVSRQGLALRHTDLNAMLRGVVYDFRDETRERDIEWHIGKLGAVDCDPRLTRQVLVNLVSNALKFSRTRAKAVIEVGESPANGNRAIFIRDNGVGFNMRYADKLFGVFQRLHGGEEFEGTGVGLAVVQRIVRKHGGTIWVEAELDKGATFYFTLWAAA